MVNTPKSRRTDTLRSDDVAAQVRAPMHYVSRTIISTYISELVDEVDVRKSTYPAL